MDLTALGWSAFFAEAFAPYAQGGFAVGRVIVQMPRLYVVATPDGDVRGHLSGTIQYRAGSAEELPAVGDWVVLRPRAGEPAVVIHAVLPRRSRFLRRAAGRTSARQVVAANVDVVFLVNALDAGFNLRRLERYLVLAAESGARPVVLLNKADLCDDPVARSQEAAAAAPGVPVHILSARRREGTDLVRAHLGHGVTAALLGPSGVGKSTIINALLGEERLKTREVRASDDRGRQTTTHREIVALPDGGLLVDTPGMRELQLPDVGQGLREAFDDVEALAAGCRFRDCRHGTEPGCAVRAALADGRLQEDRFGSYQKLRGEAEQETRKTTSRHRRGLGR